MNHVRLSVCPSVRLSVCRHLGALLCTDECSLIPRWILFSFGTWNKHILELCLGVLFLKNLKNCNFGDFLKNGDFGDLAWLLMVVCTDECSLIPRWILFSFGTWNKHILELCLGVLFLKNLKNCNCGDFLKNGDFGDLAHYEKLLVYRDVLRTRNM